MAGNPTANVATINLAQGGDPDGSTPIELVMMPITVNGHGLREVLLIFYFGKLGLGLADHSSMGVQETAIAFSALLVANDLLWSLPGGAWYFLRFKKRPAPEATHDPVLVQEGDQFLRAEVGQHLVPNDERRGQSLT